MKREEKRGFAECILIRAFGDDVACGSKGQADFIATPVSATSAEPPSPFLERAKRCGGSESYSDGIKVRWIGKATFCFA